MLEFVDQFANTAQPGPAFQFGMAMVKDKERVATAEPFDFEGEWVRHASCAVSRSRV